jgi:hypothetical protein
MSREFYHTQTTTNFDSTQKIKIFLIEKAIDFMKVISYVSPMDIDRYLKMKDKALNDLCFSAAATLT